MIGLKFKTGQGNIVEAISEPFAVQSYDTSEAMVFVRDLKTNDTYEEELYNLKSIATEEEVINSGGQADGCNNSGLCEGDRESNTD